MANQPAPAASQALAASPQERLARIPGSYRNPQAITERLQYAAKHFHLVSPATACGAVPEGCSISLSTVIIDKDAETYKVSGKFGLSKTALDKIGAAAGISWDAQQSGRIDDGSDPHYCMWRAVGRMRHLDGTEVQLVGTKEMDLREGSQVVETDTANQVREKRLHIAAHAETKARLRAIRSIGIRTAYTAEELSKPFVVAKIMWTGQSNDPELRRLFAMKQADAMIGGSRALYGNAPIAPPAAVAMMPAGVRPPPVGRPYEREDDYDAPQRTVEMPPPPPTPAPTTSAAAPAPARPATAGGGGRPPSGVVMKFGKGKGKPIEEATDRDLEWYGEAIAKSVDDPDKSRFRDANERELAAIRAEVAFRAGAPGAGASAAAPAPTGPAGGGDWGDYGGQGGDDEIPF